MQIKNCAVYLTTNILINTQKSVFCIHFNQPKALYEQCLEGALQAYPN